MIRLTGRQVMSVHAAMIEKTGGMNGIRDAGLLDSALNSPFQTFDGKEIYSSLLLKAAVMCRSIISNHPFVDGNKRTGIHVMLTFLELNGVKPKYTQKELIDLGFDIASGDLNYNAILDWLIEHTK